MDLLGKRSTFPEVEETDSQEPQPKRTFPGERYRWQRDPLRNFRLNPLGLATFCKCMDNAELDLDSLLFIQLQEVMSSDTAQKDPFGFCNAFHSLNELPRYSRAYQKQTTKVEQRFTSCMQELFCLGSLTISPLLLHKMVSGKDFLQYNQREFNPQLAHGFFTVMKGENPREKWNPNQPSTINLMFTKGISELYSIVNPSGVSEHNWCRLRPSLIGGHIQHWLNRMGEVVTSQNHPSCSNLFHLLFPFAGQHRCCAFALYMDQHPPVREWTAMFGEAMELKFWLLLPQRVSHCLSGVRFQMFVSFYLFPTNAYVLILNF